MTENKSDRESEKKKSKCQKGGDTEKHFVIH